MGLTVLVYPKYVTEIYRIKIKKEGKHFSRTLPLHVLYDGGLRVVDEQGRRHAGTVLLELDEDGRLHHLHLHINASVLRKKVDNLL